MLPQLLYKREFLTPESSSMIFLPSIFCIALVAANYAPRETKCPGVRLVREAKGMSQQESEWIAKKKTGDSLENFLASSGLDDFDAKSFLAKTAEDHPVTIGLAFSGGGFRAMLCGAGFMSALDNRTEGAHEKGLGGLLQASTYMSGLSGGSWLLGSVVSNNFTSVEDILNNKTQIWDLSYSIFDSKGSGIFNVVKYYLSLIADVFLKKIAGFQVTLTDIWGRALSHHFFGGDNFGEDIRWSDVQTMQSFVDHEMPFPFMVANAVVPGTNKVNAESPIVEISPYEFGSWDPAINAFSKTMYLGSDVNDGMPTGDSCVRGYDNAGFVLGTSSTLFNEVFGDHLSGTFNETRFNSTVNGELNQLLQGTSGVSHAVAAYKPNPFKNIKEATSKNLTQDDILSLVDGGEDYQNVPLYPLVQETRKVDVIFAYDSSADTFDDWPNGNAMYQSWQRQYSEQGRSMRVPKMPRSDVFLKEGLTSKPVFFGCSATGSGNLSSGNSTNVSNSSLEYSSDAVPPLIVYTANRKLSYDSNKSTLRFVYHENEKRGMIRNGFEVASRNNGTEDSAWRTCVSCAIIRREQERRGEAQSEQCKKCFDKYCWNP